MKQVKSNKKIISLFAVKSKIKAGGIVNHYLDKANCEKHAELMGNGTQCSAAPNKNGFILTA